MKTRMSSRKIWSVLHQRHCKAPAKYRPLCSFSECAIHFIKINTMVHHVAARSSEEAIRKLHRRIPFLQHWANHVEVLEVRGSVREMNMVGCDIRFHHEHPAFVIAHYQNRDWRDPYKWERVLDEYSQSSYERKCDLRWTPTSPVLAN